MRRVLFFIAIFLFTLSSVMGQMIPITLPADGNWPTIVGDSIMIIGPRQNELTEEQRYFNPVYLMTYPGKEHLKAQMIRAGACDCDPTIPNRRIGVFSVAPDKKVSFSQGNLQYLPAINLWKFADTQYEYLGNANKYLKPTFRNWVDLFGWSANNTTAPFGVSTSMSAADYAGDFVDWGTNTICGDAPNTWRTLSRDEWEYLLNGRENAQQLRTKGSVEGKEGVILLPDNWICPEGYTIAIIPDEANLQSNVNTYSQADWSKLEAAGAIILPSAGMRRNAIEVEVRHPNIFGGYWTCTNKDEHNSYCYTFHTQDCEYVDYSNHIYGRSVRLVHDTIVPETIPDPCFVVKVNDTLSINMMCVEGGTFTMGDGENAHPVSLSNYSIAQTEVTQGLWEQVMGYNNSLFKGEYLPVEKVSWEECQTFIQKLNEMTGKHFRLPTEAEWEYAARGGKNSHGYTYAGSNSIDSVAWYQSNSQEQTHTIATLMPNELGIYDMSGNVWEWCEDYYDTDETMHVVKSGSFYDLASTCRIDFRTARLADYKSYIGLRLVLDDTALTPPEPEYVDLGLSVKWATFNVGATSPEDYGDYFAWGETEPKETYSWATYKWCDGTDANITKYNTADGKTILEPADDAAQVNWGGKWRMPTEEEQQELIDRCSWERTNLNGVIGYKVTGPNGNSIFIPIAGAYNSFDNQLNSVGSIGWIYSSTIATEIRAYEIHIEEGIILQKDCSRCVGLTIRPVYDDRPEPCLVVKVNDTLSINLMCVEGGTFMMGRNDAGAPANEKPAHQVTLSDYLISQTEVTQGLWQAVMGTTDYKDILNNNNADTYQIGAEYPAYGIKLSEAQAFINRLNQLTNLNFRLPTEAEWEYAARGGQNSKGYIYSGSNNLDEIAWYTLNSNNEMHRVAQLKPNELGIYDMSGNGWEICADGYANYSAEAQINPLVERTGNMVIRGGSSYNAWSTDVYQVTYRMGRAPEQPHNRNVIRLVLHDIVPVQPEPEYVDLGLSVKWATFNVGATSPNEIGNFYAWGEIEPKDTYTVNNYKWWNKTSKETTKYCTIDSLAYGGVADGLTELQPQDDIAHILKGEHWRMPDLDECKELGNGCTWTVSTRQGQIGFEGTSKINGNTIFLPVVGFRAGANLVHETLGGYWSSTLNIEKQSCAMGLYLNRETPSVGIYYNSSRQNGFLIRPVYDEVPDP